MEKKTVMIPFEITQEFVDDVMCTALEGGITYWCGKAEIIPVPELSENMFDGLHASQVISQPYGSLSLYDAEDMDAATGWELDLDKFIKGYEKYIEWCIKRNQEIYTDPADIDAEIADIIVQFAVFGEIQFG